MLFNSLPFLIFFPIFTVLYFLLRGNTRLFFCLSSSYFFYGWWDYRFIIVIMLSTSANYLFGYLIYNENSEIKRKIKLLSIIIINLSLLAVFKYLNFFIKTFNELFAGFNDSIKTTEFYIILPVGISFYTFHSLSYIADVYWKRIAVERSFLRFANYVSIFPHLVAGPILRAEKLLPQFQHDHQFSWPRIIAGAEMALAGYFMKVVVADSLAPLVERMLSNPEAETSLTLAIGVFFFAFQIYCDFNGYSKIAIGIAKILGFDFGINFNRPYFSCNFSDFWMRWHISLSQWLRDYLYIPLGGNRFGKLKTIKNIIITMLLGGLWHGANWTFVIWGGLHAAYLIIQNTISFLFSPVRIKGTLLHNTLRLFQIGAVFVLVCFAWIFFRAPNINNATSIILGIFKLDTFNFYFVPEKFLVIKCFTLIAITIIIEFALEIGWLSSAIHNSTTLRICSSLLIIWSISFLGTFRGASFIYFQF
ncbi:MAG: MBOAT family O-acyltransferase [Syntrophomonas sp.]